MALRFEFRNFTVEDFRRVRSFVLKLQVCCYDVNLQFHRKRNCNFNFYEMTQYYARKSPGPTYVLQNYFQITQASQYRTHYHLHPYNTESQQKITALFQNGPQIISQHVCYSKRLNCLVFDAVINLLVALRKSLITGYRWYRCIFSL